MFALAVVIVVEPPVTNTLPLALVTVFVPPDIVTGFDPPKEVKVLVPFTTLNLCPVK